MLLAGEVKARIVKCYERYHEDEGGRLIDFKYGEVRVTTRQAGRDGISYAVCIIAAFSAVTARESHVNRASSTATSISHSSSRPMLWRGPHLCYGVLLALSSTSLSRTAYTIEQAKTGSICLLDAEILLGMWASKQCVWYPECCLSELWAVQISVLSMLLLPLTT